MKAKITPDHVAVWRHYLLAAVDKVTGMPIAEMQEADEVSHTVTMTDEQTGERVKVTVCIDLWPDEDDSLGAADG